MEKLIDSFLVWWETNNVSVAESIFHKDVFYRSCASGNAINLMNSDVFEINDAEIKVIKTFFCSDQATLIFEQAEEISRLYYRFCIYLRSSDGKIIEVIKTKESVANEGEL